MAGVDLILSNVCNATFCEDVYDNPIIETQSTVKQNATLALLDAVNGQHLRIGTINNYPMSWVEKTENGTLIGQGVAFVIVDILRQRFNFTFEVVVPEKNFELGGRKPEDSLIGLVKKNKVDMAAAFLPVVLKYKQSVTYSEPLDEGIWSMMLTRPRESAAGSGLLAPFHTYVWYFILAAVLLYGPCITLLTYLRSKLIRDDEKPISISPSAWFVYGAFIKQGTTLAPDANTTRVLFATWWLFVILLSAFYTANLTAFLTLSKFTLDIEYPQDLLRKNYRWVAAEGSAVEYAIKDSMDDLNYLNKMVINGRGQFKSTENEKKLVTFVTGGAVLIKEATAIDSIMYENYLKKAREGVQESDRCTYVVAPNSFMKRSRAFAYPKNSTLNNLFRSVLVYLVQAGMIRFLETRDLPSTKICPLDLQSNERQLRNSDLLMTYMIMVVGLAAAIAVFIGELLVKRYLRVKIIDSSKPKRSKKTKGYKRSNRDDSRPPPYDSLFGNRSRVRFREDSERRIINGREYYVVSVASGHTRLIPVRTPSAFLYR